MATFENCRLKDKCKTAGNCSFQCYPFTFLHGNEGSSGLWKTRNVPRKYDGCFSYNFVQIQPTATKETMLRYMKNCLEHVNNGVGMFLYSIPTKGNPMGTGTGKTTTACSIVNVFLVRRVFQHLRGESTIKNNPVLFVKMSEFQNVYNGQFRGDRQTQEESSSKYYTYKNRMKTVELLVIDDIAIRNGTEAFLNEVYEIIDHRVTEEKATIYTSNYPLSELAEFMGERIVSRIVGSTYAYPFTGEDHRMKGKVI